MTAELFSEDGKVRQASLLPLAACGSRWHPENAPGRDEVLL